MILGIDIGSSSVKAALLRGERPIGKIGRVSYPTHLDGPRVEVDPKKILRAIHQAIGQLGSCAPHPQDRCGCTVGDVTRLACDESSRQADYADRHPPGSPQCRRSNRNRKSSRQSPTSPSGGQSPFPGGISSTTWAWFKKHEAATMQRADLVGHLNTFLIRTWTSNRIIDPSNASFTGLYRTLTQSGWSDELCENVKLPKHLLPDVIESNQIAGKHRSVAGKRAWFADRRAGFSRDDRHQFRDASHRRECRTIIELDRLHRCARVVYQSPAPTRTPADTHSASASDGCPSARWPPPDQPWSGHTSSSSRIILGIGSML